MSKIDKNRLRSLIDEGKTQSEIARIHGCSRAAVSKQVKKLQLKKNEETMSAVIESWWERNLFGMDRAVLEYTCKKFFGFLEPLWERNFQSLKELSEMPRTLDNARQVHTLSMQLCTLNRVICQENDLWMIIEELEQMLDVVLGILKDMPAGQNEEFRWLLTQKKDHTFVWNFRKKRRKRTSKPFTRF